MGASVVVFGIASVGVLDSDALRDTIAVVDLESDWELLFVTTSCSLCDDTVDLLCDTSMVDEWLLVGRVFEGVASTVAVLALRHSAGRCSPRLLKAPLSTRVLGL